MSLDRNFRDPSPRKKQWAVGSRFVAITLLSGMLTGLMPAMSLAQVAAGTERQITPQRLFADAVATMTPDLEKEIQQAITSYQSGNFAATRASLEKAKELEPSLAPVDVMVARLHFLAGQMPNGRATLEMAVINHPDDPEPYLIFAEEALGANRVTDAVLLYEKAVKLIKTFSSNDLRKENFKLRTRAGLAGIAERRNQWSDAVVHLQAWIKEKPDSATAYTRLAQALFMSREGDDDAQLQKTIEAFGNAQKIEPKISSPNVLVSQLYGRLYARDKNETYREMADTYMKRALESDGDALSTVVSAASWALDDGRLDEADSLLTKARLLDSSNHSVALLSGVVARIKKDHKAAEEYLLAALQAKLGDWTTANQLVLALVDQGDAEKNKRALDYAMQIAQKNATNANASATLGWVYYQMNDQANANKFFGNAARIGGTNLNSDSRYFLARAIFDKGTNNNAAAQQLTAALAGARLFMYRTEAQALLDKIAVTPGTAPPQN